MFCLILHCSIPVVLKLYLPWNVRRVVPHKKIRDPSQDGQLYETDRFPSQNNVCTRTI